MITATWIFIQSRFIPRIKTWIAISPLFIMTIAYFGIRGPGFLVTEMPIPVKIPGMVYAGLKKHLYYGPRELVDLIPEKSPIQRLIFIVDESVRGDKLGINGFKKSTTPFLNSVISQHYNYGIAVSGANCSAPSNILLQTGVTYTQVPDTNSVIFKSANIFQYAKNAGYKTFYIPVRGNPGAYSDFMSKYDFHAIDKAIYIKHKNPSNSRYEADFLLAKEIVNIIKKYPDEKIFIYALKEGNHFLYKDAYPRTAVVFPDDTNNSTENLRNSYYNALIWVVDHFMQTMLDDLKDINSTIVYTSDHGQGLREKGDFSTHCKPTMAMHNQANVPLIVLTTKNDKDHIEKLTTPYFKKNINHVSHFNLFPSLLVMMGYDQSSVNTRYSKTIFQNLENQKRYFLSGDLWTKAYKTEFNIMEKEE